MPEIERIETTEPDMMQRHFEAFCSELREGQYRAAHDRIKNWSATEAVQLVLAALCRRDADVHPITLDELAESLGVLEDWRPED